jgi:hypothetical protein
MTAGHASRLVNERSLCPVCYRPIAPGDGVHRETDNTNVHFDCFGLWPWQPSVDAVPPAG